MDEARLNLTRRFRSAREAKDEAESNLSAGSLWVPLEEGGERPALLRAVIVALQLEDGSVLEGLRGRVTCLAPTGCAVVLDDLPPANVLTRLLGGELPPPPAASDLAPEDAPPLPAGLESGGWQPIAASTPGAPRFTPPPIPSAFDAPPPMSPLAPPPPTPPAVPEPLQAQTVVEPLQPQTVVEPPPSPDARFDSPSIPDVRFAEPPIPAPLEPEVPVTEPALREAPVTEPALRVAPPATPPDARPVSATPVAFDEVRGSEPASTESPDTADFPMMREQPVPAVSAPANIWGDDANLEPELKVLRPAEDEPAEPLRPQFTVRYTDAAALETAWKGELGAGRVFLPSADPPALDARVEVTLLLPDVGALVLEGTVVHRAGNGVGAKLDMDGTTRALIESALPSNAGVQDARAERASSSVGAVGANAAPASPPPAPVAEPVPGAAATPRRPSIELRKDETGRNVLVVSFESLSDFRREYETNIRRGGVMVPTQERPPVRSVIEIVFSLLGGKREVRLKGEVVLHGPTGIGVQLGEIPASSRVEIESLIAAAGPSASEQAAQAQAPAAAPVVRPPPASISTPPPPMNAPPAPMNGPPPMGAAPSAPRPMAQPATPIAAAAGVRFEGELVEVMREAEVEGEAGVSGLASKASWLKVLAHLQATKSSGVLRAIRKAETKSYAVVQGRLIDAKGEPPRDDESMIRVIRKNNLARPGVLRVLDRALDKAPDELKALESANIWSAAEIDRARRWQILERASEIFAWEKGRFEFDPNGDRAWARPSGGVPVGHVILHGVRSYLRASGDDLARILRSGLDRTLRVVPNTGFEPSRAGLADKDLKLWAEVDGKKTLRQVLGTSPIAQTQAHRIIFALCRLGVLAFDRGAGGGARAAGGKEADRLDALRARLADMKVRDAFSKLSVSWMSAAAQVQAGWEALRRELDADTRASGPIADTAKQILAEGETAWRQLMDDRTRRLQRLKIIEDPSRIEAAADMLADRAELLRMQGDKAGAESALQMALDMAPGNGTFLQQLARVRAG